MYGGATRGTNLFHSFKQFSIPTGGSAYFNNAPDIQNIFSRVTGRDADNPSGAMPLYESIGFRQENTRMSYVKDV